MGFLRYSLAKEFNIMAINYKFTTEANMIDDEDKADMLEELKTL